jgi:hypothetical protein
VLKRLCLFTKKFWGIFERVFLVGTRLLAQISQGDSLKAKSGSMETVK